MDIEVAQILRRHVHRGELTASRAQQSLDDLPLMPIERHALVAFIPRIWELRDSMTAYDLEAPLLTGDEKLSRARGHSAAIEVIR